MSDAGARRRVGTLSLTFVAVGGVVGSGILFAPLFAAQAAGPAAILAWPIAGVMMILIALTFAEVAAMLPVVGGLGRLPAFSHGPGAGAAVGWVAWIGYVTATPIETQAMLEYASNEPVFAWLFASATSSGGQDPLSPEGVAVAAALLALFTVINALGVAVFARINTVLTWVKVAIPIVIAIALLTQYSSAPIEVTGFAPDGAAGVMAAISTGGVVFAFLGFRHALDLAGEAKAPQRTIPIALIGGILICVVLFTVLQAGFIGAVSTDDLSNGWNGLAPGGANGPLAAMLVGLGYAAIANLVLADAVVGPLGAALVSTASTGRLVVAVSQSGLFPRVLRRMSSRGVPTRALVLNAVVGFLLLLAFRDGWSELLAFNSGAIVLSMCMGPITAAALRRRAPDRARPFRLPALPLVARAAFVVVALIIYWTGWDTMWKLSLPIAVGAVILVARILADRGYARTLAWRSMIWLGPFYLGLLLLTLLGRFGGGLGVLPAYVDLVVVAVFALAIYEWAVRSGMPAADVAAALRTVPERVPDA